MKKFAPILFLFIIIAGLSCDKDDENTGLTPDPGYPYTYFKMDQEELANKIEIFKSSCHLEGLTLNEFGLISGKFSLNLTSGVNSDFLIKIFSEIIRSYNKYLETEYHNQIEFTGKIFVSLAGGSMPLEKYSKYYKLEFPLVLNLQQEKIGNYPIENGIMTLLLFSEGNSVSLGGFWFPKAIIPSHEIIPANKALKISEKYIQKNFADKLPVNPCSADENKLSKVLYPHRIGNKIEIHECWKIDFGNNMISSYIDTQTGEVIQSFCRPI